MPTIARDDGLDVGARRDTATIRAWLPKLERMFSRYHRAHVEGLEHVPEGAALAVGNHNGGVMSPDMFALMAAWWRHFGVDMPSYGLMHDLPFRFPFFGKLLSRLGAVHAHPANAEALLRRGAKVLVYPGGDIDAFRPWSKRHAIVFGERIGFVKVALRTRAPIVPVVSVGAHEAFRVLTDGRDLVKRLGLKRLARVEVLPIVLCLPWGLALAPTFYVPLPVTIRIRVLPPMRWPDLPASAADDDAIVRRCRDEVRAAMQDALSDLAREGGYGPRLFTNGRARSPNGSPRREPGAY
jgi:1-acyl-sn-glycerol-3-phosphate acyltransferase